MVFTHRYIHLQQSKMNKIGNKGHLDKGFVFVPYIMCYQTTIIDETTLNNSQFYLSGKRVREIKKILSKIR